LKRRKGGAMTRHIGVVACSAEGAALEKATGIEPEQA